MTNTPPDPKSSQTNALGFDEFIGILVAFATIGTILFWSISRRDAGWNVNGLFLPSPTPSPTSSPPATGVQTSTPAVESRQTPSPSAQRTPVEENTPFFNITPTPLPQEEPPSPFSTNTTGTFPLLVPPEKKSTIPPPIAFNDVPGDFWARRFIDVLSSRNIIKGYEDYSFRPNQPVTRAEFAAIIQQAFNNQVGETKTKIAFKDVPGQFWANPAIDQSISTGFLRGYPDKSFRPEQKIPRVQVLVALASGLNLSVPASPDKPLSLYKDATQIPRYALDKVAASTESGLVVNYPDPTVFAPNKEATRAEVAAMVHQALVQMGKLDAIKSENIVKAPN